MPTGKVKWYSAEKGFGFVSQEEGEDVYVGSSALPAGVEELKAGHIIIAIETPSERLDEAVKIASQNGARRLVHFGLMTVTWLTK